MKKQLFHLEILVLFHSNLLFLLVFNTYCQLNRDVANTNFIVLSLK